MNLPFLEVPIYRQRRAFFFPSEYSDIILLPFLSFEPRKRLTDRVDILIPDSGTSKYPLSLHIIRNQDQRRQNQRLRLAAIATFKR